MNLLFDLDFISFVLGITISAIVCLLIWNRTRKHTQDKLQALRLSFEREEKLKKQEITQLQEKGRLTLQKEQMDSMQSLSKLKKEQEALLHKLEVQEKRLNDKEKLLDQEKKKLITLIEKHASAPLESLIQKIAEKDLRERKIQAQTDLKLLEQECGVKAQTILLSALERATLPSTRDLTSISIPLPSESLIPQLIGKEGKTIRRFEELMGVSARIDEPTQSLIISSYNGKRRAQAEMLAHALFEAGKISQKIVEELAGVVEKNFASHSVLKGQKVADVLKLKLPKLILSQIGEMEFYSSFGQNLLLHSQEVAQIAQTLAFELKLDGKKAALMGLLHDIGKTLPDNTSSHAIGGAEFVRNAGLADDIVNGIASHHREVAPKTPEAKLIPIADALSASIPGARLVSLEELKNRSEAIELAALQFPGILQAYCQDGGKTLHLIVKSESKELVHDDIFKQQLLKNIPSIKSVSFQVSPTI